MTSSLRVDIQIFSEWKQDMTKKYKPAVNYKIKAKHPANPISGGYGKTSYGFRAWYWKRERSHCMICPINKKTLLCSKEPRSYNDNNRFERIKQERRP